MKLRLNLGVFLVLMTLGVADGAITSGEYVYSNLTSLPDLKMLTKGRETNGKEFFCAAQLVGDKYNILRLDNTSPLLREDEIPEGQRLVVPVPNLLPLRRPFGCLGETVTFLAAHPNQVVGTSPLLSVLQKTPNGGVQTLATRGTQFVSFEPVSKVNVTYSHLQTGFITTQGTRVAAQVVAQPQTQNASVPQALFLEYSQAEGKWNTLVNTTGASITPVAACLTDNVFHFTGQVAGIGQGRYHLWEVRNGQMKMIKSALNFYGNHITCGPNGVIMSYREDNGNFTFLHRSDSGLEQVLFTGAAVEDLILATNDAVLYQSPTEAIVISGQRWWASLSEGKGRVIKRTQQAPVGSTIDVITVNGVTLYVGSAQFNQTYQVFSPRPGSTTLTGTVKQVATLSHNLDFVIEGQLPTLLANLPYIAATNGDIGIQMPDIPGTYNVQLDIKGVRRTLTLIATPEGAPVPKVLAVLNAAVQDDSPVAPRSQINIFFAGAFGMRAATGPDPSFELGGVSVEMCGSPIRLVSNSGQGVVSGFVPQAALGKGDCQVTVQVQTESGTGRSDSFNVKISEMSNKLFRYYDPAANLVLPYVFDDKGLLISSFNRARSDQKLSAYGTGCGLPIPIGDSENTPTEGVQLLLMPVIKINGQPVEVSSAGLVGGSVGLCRYDFKTPMNLSGVNTLSFVDDSVGVEYVLLVQ